MVEGLNMLPFRVHHLYALINSLYTSPVSETQRVAAYFKQHKSLGSKDRQWISSRIFAIIKHQRLLRALIRDDNLSITPETLVAKVESGVLDCVHDLPFPWQVRYSISDDLANVLVQQFGEACAEQLARVFLEEAPVTIRVNTQKISVERLQEILPFPSLRASEPTALHFAQRYPLQHTKAFRLGLFEIQDESSQTVAFSLPIGQADTVLDFCAGAGGKSLVFAQRAHHVVLHDTRPAILQEARTRLLRAGNKNFSIGKKFMRPGSFPVVVVDAPCSGSGVFRRHIEKKLQFSTSLLHDYVRVQRKILREAARYVSKNGILSYITCSILSEENALQASYMESLGWQMIHTKDIPLRSGQGDGFFTCSWARTSSAS